MTYPQQQHFPPPGYKPPTAPPTAGRVWKRAAIVAAVVVALAVGLLAGVLFRPDNNNEPAAPVTATTAASDIHSADVGLCTAFAIINSALPKQDSRAGDLLPGLAALQAALTAHPDAQPAIRDSITDFITALYARIGSYAPVRARGLADPPAYDKTAAQAAYDGPWTACDLDEG